MRTICQILVSASLLVVSGCLESADSGKTHPASKAKDVAGKRIQFLEFHAVWCEPCRDQKPIVERLKPQFPNVDFQLIDIDDDVSQARKYKVDAVPYMFVLVDGEVVERFRGLQSHEKLTAALNRATRLASQSSAP